MNHLSPLIFRLFTIVLSLATGIGWLHPATANELPQLTTVATPFALPDAGRDFQKPWDSQEQLGWQSLLVVVLGEGKPVSAQALQSLQQAATPLRSQDVAVLLVSADKKIAQQVANAGANTQPPPLLSLWDNKSLFRQRLQLSNITISPQQPVLIAIDRAGYLRQIRPLDNLEQSASLLQEIGDPTPKLEVGQPAPQFSITDMNGKTRSLSEFRGRKHLLLTFFPRCFTGNCKAQLSSLGDEYSALQANDLEVLAVSVDPAEGGTGQIAYAKHLNLPYDLLSDTGRNLSILYGAANSPHQMAARQSVLIDKHGIVRWIDKQVSPTTHGTDVLEKMRELGMTVEETKE